MEKSMNSQKVDYPHRDVKSITKCKIKMQNILSNSFDMKQGLIFIASNFKTSTGT